ncbi:YggT family protein [Cricetibacter osteomyelitidis]|uniref:YggT family protein n=1 Tax=Cricetibacter osteomyelitidis TaxID=1521931 RepID=A0A4R2SS99_9PAST|nr:YggT family protein [Cricetibacter osteomyelitidis]TCP93207.1 YggT family protein [Cricetibacter osteomyelitidis]
MSAIQELVKFVIEIYAMILLLRAWLQYCKVDFYNPISQTIVKFTQPVLAPVRKFIPNKNNLDLAAIVAAFVLCALKYPLIALVSGEFITDWTSAVIVGALGVVKTAGTVLIYMIFIRAILSWFSRGQNPVDYVLYQLTEPLMSPIRKFLPRTGMIDFAPMILVFVLYFINRFLYDILGAYWALA